MDDKLQQFFNDNDFDILEPHSDHSKRFHKKLKTPQKQQKPKIFWIVLLPQLH